MGGNIHPVLLTHYEFFTLTYQNPFGKKPVL